MDVNFGTVSRHINKLGYVQKYARWVPHQLSEKNVEDRFSICSALFVRQKNEPFLDRLITSDEKWVTYENVIHKKAKLLPGQEIPSVPRPNIHQKKQMLSIWWDRRGPIHWELLESQKTINSDVYSEQLDRLDAEIKKKRPSVANRKGVLLQHDNARPHVSMKTRQKFQELGYEVLPHPAYSPDLAPSDYHLFLSLQNFLNGKTFVDQTAVESSITDFLGSKPESFYAAGIDKLPIRWKRVLQIDGAYFDE